jgi:hypothetical protein
LLCCCCCCYVLLLLCVVVVMCCCCYVLLLLCVVVVMCCCCYVLLCVVVVMCCYDLLLLCVVGLDSHVPLFFFKFSFSRLPVLTILQVQFMGDLRKVPEEKIRALALPDWLKSGLIGLAKATPPAPTTSSTNAHQ